MHLSLIVIVPNISFPELRTHSHTPKCLAGKLTIGAKLEPNESRHRVGAGVVAGVQELGSRLVTVREGASGIYFVENPVSYHISIRTTAVQKLRRNEPGILTHRADGIMRRLLVGAAFVSEEVDAGIYSRGVYSSESSRVIPVSSSDRGLTLLAVLGHDGRSSPGRVSVTVSIGPR